MLLSVSRRTDIPALYADWFFNRLKEGSVCVRNPMNPRQVRRLSLTPENVQGIVLWTKNPAPMLDRLKELENYPYYFQFTLTSYGTDVEPGLPDKRTVLLPLLRRLSHEIGPERIIWRYDPILLSPFYTVEKQLNSFAQMAQELKGCVRKCTFSFMDAYKNTARNAEKMKLCSITTEDMLTLAKGMSDIAHEVGLTLDTCAEEIPLEQFGIAHARCVDAGLFTELSGRPVPMAKDRNQRPACGCAASVDIGAYNTCTHGCLYCYANYTPGAIAQHARQHNPLSPLLIGELSPLDRITDVK